MDPRVLCFALVLIFSSTTSVNAFNITRILEQYPEFSTFNALLNTTKLAAEINHRQTITVLAVDNGAAGGISGKPSDLVKSILSAHVILDYYDVQKLKKLSKQSSILTTLFQTTGNATHQQGFVNVTKMSNGDILFGSATKGAELNSKLMQVVTTRPYNISVLQVSSIIEAPGLDLAPPSPPKAKAPTSAPPPKSSSPAEAPAPSDDEGVEADAPIEAPTPADADAPVADAPASSPPVAEDVADQADAPEPNQSGASQVGYSSGVAAVMGLVAWIW
ncbi:hypothetical protein HS088_TW23G01055 [Tripterygium wilfordii]|uniref:FAS1 domain-containing protein n=1 Tax=Tripterygium wilfordii TaxID=458696 RepID=A0A7J7BWN4_TRIWF|nr:fasciclin-like arabinogalactan protein 3 [Tripterygium wilfordii]KAF5726310.1 hypothetical protein HS088_TW23G01055 [Tripterygium wilfordii]